MDLKRKLARLGPPGPNAGSKPPTAPEPGAVAAPVEPPRNEVASGVPGPDKLRRLIGALAERTRPPHAVRSHPTSNAPQLTVETRETPHGRIHVREQLYGPSHCHGTAPVRAALDADPSHVAALALDAGLRELDLRRMLLLDTETTGLAGGTGTLPFVVGLGWFEGDVLKVQQFLLRRPGEEGPILRHLEERLGASSCLVTYNGKTFDWPLLKSRYVMNRLKVPKPLPHLDLLHCARRVFRHRMKNGAKLVQLEEEVLGYVRQGDVPGSEIPELYFRYLRNGDGRLLDPVLEHNAQDMALLAALLGVIARQFGAAGAEGDPRDQLGYAQIASRNRDFDRALAFAQAAAKGGGPNELAAEAFALASSVSRRNGDAHAALDALQRALEYAPREARPALHLELSKLLEHRLRNMERALLHARQSSGAEDPDAHARRIERLERKLARRGDTLPLV